MSRRSADVLAVIASVTASANRFERARQCARSRRAQVASHDRPWSIPAGDGRSQGDPGDTGRAVGECDQPAAVVERRPGDIRDRGKPGDARVQERHGVGWPAGGLGGTHAGDHERREQDPLPDRLGTLEGVLADREGSVRVAGLRRHLGEPPQGRQDEPDLLRSSRRTASASLRAPVAPARSPRSRSTYPSAQRAIDAPRRQPLSATACFARRWASAGSAPAHDTMAEVARMRCGAVRLLDGIRVAKALVDPVVRRAVVDGSRGQHRRVAERADPGAFPAGTFRRPSATSPARVRPPSTSPEMTSAGPLLPVGDHPKLRIVDPVTGAACGPWRAWLGPPAGPAHR